MVGKLEFGSPGMERVNQRLDRAFHPQHAFLVGNGTAAVDRRPSGGAHQTEGEFFLLVRNSARIGEERSPDFKEHRRFRLTREVPPKGI